MPMLVLVLNGFWRLIRLIHGCKTGFLSALGSAFWVVVKPYHSRFCLPNSNWQVHKNLFPNFIEND
jgi:hypothetical protein